MKEWPRIEFRDCIITAWLAESAAEAQVLSIRVARGDAELRNEIIRLTYPLAFAHHVEDVAALDERIDEIIGDMDLGRGDDTRKPAMIRGRCWSEPSAPMRSAVAVRVRGCGQTLRGAPRSVAADRQEDGAKTRHRKATGR